MPGERAYRVYPGRLCVCFRLFVCFQNRVQPTTSSCMVGFEKYLAQMIIRTRRVACKNHVARSKVKVTVGTLILCIPESFPTHNSI